MDKDKPVMYILVNTDLKMTSGKVASQVAHVTQFIIEALKDIEVNLRNPMIPLTTLTTLNRKAYFTYMEWKNNCVKVILGATTEQLENLKKMPEARHVIEKDSTEVPDNSLTVVGFFPSSDLKELMTSYKLF